MFTLLAFVIVSIPSTFGENVTIDTILGNVTGEQMDDYVLFRGIPYAEHAPIGDRRFTESVVRTANFPTNPYPATDFSPSCIQNIALNFASS